MIYACGDCGAPVITTPEQDADFDVVREMLIDHYKICTERPRTEWDDDVANTGR